MVNFAQKYLDDLPIHRDQVESAYRYFKENNQRYEESRTFLFKTTISEELRSTLVNINWPIFEVNTLESFVSRLAGEFAKQLPSPTVIATQQKSNDQKTIALVQLLEGRLRYIFESSQTDNAKKAIYIEAMSGGFSAAKLIVDYINPFSFELDVTFDKCFDPTLCYFDPIARKNHKGDGRFCGEIVPFTEDEFKMEWPDIDINEVEYSRDALTGGNLHWYYTEGEDSSIRKIVYVADHYVKKEVKEKIVQIKLPNLKPIIQKILDATKQYIMQKQQQAQQQQAQQQTSVQQNNANPGQPMGTPSQTAMPQMNNMQPPMQPPMQSSAPPPGASPQQPPSSQPSQSSQNPPQPYLLKTMTEDEYEVFAKMWSEHTMLPAPKIMRKRTTIVTEIWHYRFTRDTLLERPKKTNFTILPIVFFDGNSHILANKQMTRPYHYQAVDAQKMKNIAGIAMMNAIENMPQTRMLWAKESIPKEPAYLETIKNPQKPSAGFVYNSMGQTNDGKPLSPPQPLNFNAFSTELIQLYNDMDKTIQTILGNFDQQLGLQQKDLSGLAIQEGATQSNNAAMPYINNYMDSMNQIANGIIQMIPKLVKTPRTIPIIDKNGLHQAVMVNDPTDDLTKMDYNAMDLEVVVKSSVNFEIQKQRTFDNLSQLMKTSQPWMAFFSGPGAPDLLDNMTVRNQDAIKRNFLDFQEQQQANTAQQQQLALMTNPVMAQYFETQSNTQLKQQQMQIDTMAQKMDHQIAGMKMLQTMIESIAGLRESADKLAIQKSQIDAENRRTAADNAGSALDAAISVDKHVGDQFDRQMEHVYRQIELGDKLNETEIKRQALSQKSDGSTGDERNQSQSLPG